MVREWYSRDRLVDAACRTARQRCTSTRARDLSRRCGVLFLSGCPARNLREPAHSERRAIRRAARPACRWASGRHARSCEQAEGFFRRALEVEPAPRRSPPAATAACSGCLGRHAEAAGELRQALRRPPTPLLRYYARAVSRRRGRGARPRRCGARRVRAGRGAVSDARSRRCWRSAASRAGAASRRRAARARSRCSRCSRPTRTHDDPVVDVSRRAGAERGSAARGAAAAVPLGARSDDARLPVRCVAAAARRPASGATQSPAFSAKVEAVRVDVLVTDNGQAGASVWRRRISKCSTTACRSRSISSASNRFR